MLSIQSLQMTTRIRTAAQRAGTLGVFALASALAFVPAAQAELQPMNVRIAADLTGPPHPAGVAMEYIRANLPKVIPGSKVQLYYAGALYRIPEAVEAMTAGDLEMTWGQFGKSAQIEPYMAIVNGPLLITTPGAMNQLDKFETVTMLKERMLSGHGVRILGTAHLSWYIGMGFKSRVDSPDDLKGLKVRSTGPAENAALGAWGANPQTMAFGDVPPALETGVIDGLVTSLGGFNVTKEQAPFFTVAGINGVVGDYYWLGVSDQWLSKFNKETQDAFTKFIVTDVIPFQKKMNFCNDLRMLDKYGTKDPSKPGIYILKPDEAAGFQDLLGDATTKWVKKNTPKPADPWVDRFIEEAKAAVAAHPLGSDPLEQTNCEEMNPYFTKYGKWVRPKKKK
jgi:TRAP-type C4-dicarboxylate transport system substrate-binding protein